MFRIIHDKDEILGLNPLVAYFFFTEETARYKAIMANPCDDRTIFRFERLDKGAEMAHVLKETDLGEALEECNMLVRLFTENGKNDEYFVANIPYQGRPRDMRPYVDILMHEVYFIDQRNISIRLENLSEDDADVRMMLSYVLDNLNGLKHDRSFFLNESEKKELKILEEKIDELDSELYPHVNYCISTETEFDIPDVSTDESFNKFERDDMMCFEICKPSSRRVPRPKHVKTEEEKEREKALKHERKQKEELLEQILAKIRAITDVADSMEMDELEKLWKILSGCNTSIEDSNDIAAGIFDEGKSAHLTYRHYMERIPDEKYEVNVKIDMFETDGRQHKMKYGLIIAINGETFRVHFTSNDSSMLYITTLSRLKYNIALTRDNLTIRKNLFEKKRKSIEDIGFIYKYLCSGSTKSFENWYLKMDDLKNNDQSFIDECHKKQENLVDGAISHANKDIFKQISAKYPKAMYYLGISNQDKERYQVRISQDDICLPPFFVTSLDKIYNV